MSPWPDSRERLEVDDEGAGAGVAMLGGCLRSSCPFGSSSRYSDDDNYVDYDVVTTADEGRELL